MVGVDVLYVQGTVVGVVLDGQLVNSCVEQIRQPCISEAVKLHLLRQQQVTSHLIPTLGEVITPGRTDRWQHLLPSTKEVIIAILILLNQRHKVFLYLSCDGGTTSLPILGILGFYQYIK